jgi:hypothetical protein
MLEDLRSATTHYLAYQHGEVASVENRLDDIYQNRMFNWYLEHRTFPIDEAPFRSSRTVGQGSLGFVEEVQLTTEANAPMCTVIRKRISINHQKNRYNIAATEVEHLKQLKHPHVVQLVGTY